MKPIKVLLVDDEEDFVTTVSDRVKEYRFKTDTALSGEQAIELVAGPPPLRAPTVPFCCFAM